MEHDAAVLSLLAEWEERRDRGAAVTPEELCAAAPHLAAALRRLIGVLEGCDRLLAVDEDFPSVARAAPVPAQVGKYAIQGELGHGGMGVVYRAWDPALCRTVALKMLRPATPVAPDDGRRLARRFRQEGQVLARLRHEFIVPVYEAVLDDAGPYFVMEYVPGGSLAEHRQRLTAAGPAAVAEFMERVARAVAHAHGHGVLHRDLKPANVLLDDDGRPRVSDFGLAKLLEPSAEAGDGPPAAEVAGDDTAEAAATQLTAPGRQPGTRAYMAPEQFDATFGPVGPAADVWALGVILYELLAGRRPFPGSRWDELRQQVCFGAVPPPGRQPRPLARVVLRCLEKDPAKRYRTAGELADALRQAAAPRRRWLWAGSLAAALGLAAAGIALWHPPQQAANLQTQAAETPAWPDLPPVQDALDRLRRGEDVVLIDGGPPAAFGWAMGPGSGKVLETPDGLFSIAASGLEGCYVDLLPALPPGRYRVEAVIRHDTGEGRSSVGAYVAGSRGLSAVGRNVLMVSLAFAEYGILPQPPYAPREPAEGKGTAMLMADYTGESKSRDFRSYTTFEAYRPFRTAAETNTPAGWRAASLEVSERGVTAGWDGAEFGTLPWAKFSEHQAQVCRRFNDLTPDLLPARPHGAVGFFVCKGIVTVKQFRVRPLGADTWSDRPNRRVEHGR